MRKIVSLFKRDYEGDRRVYDEVVPGAEWVVAGEGVATRKWDGTACLVQDGEFFKRYDAKRGKTLPPGFSPAQEPDEKTGHWPGWVLVGVGPDDKWHRAAWKNYWSYYQTSPPDGTYELVGPKVQGNPERREHHELEPHGADHLAAPRDYEGLRQWFATHDVEGIVWHHPDGRMVKIKAKDFGIRRRGQS